MKAVWHYTDKKTGARTEVWLDDEQQAIDLAIVADFEALQISVALEEADPNKDPRPGKILELAERLPPLKRRHWAEELERIGYRPPAPPPKKATGKIKEGFDHHD